MIKKTLFILLFAFFLSACQNNQVQTPPSPAPTSTSKSYQLQVNNPTSTMNPTAPITPEKLSENIIATFKPSKGDIVVELFPKAAPLTVANFVGLAKGTKGWQNPKTGDKIIGKPLYSGTIFHRVIPNFMIQGGDPLGQGTGGPGYKFADEFNNGYDFSEPYMLAMANSGPSTNGSQFFITVAPTTWLNNKHTIFGKVTKGQEIVDAIANTKTLPGDKPVETISLNSVEITEK